MQTQGTVFDDLARLMTGAMGVAQGVSEEAKTFVRTQADRFVADMDLVSRDEFEAMQETVRELRAKIEELETKLAGR